MNQINKKGQSKTLMGTEKESNTQQKEKKNNGYWLEV